MTSDPTMASWSGLCCCCRTDVVVVVCLAAISVVVVVVDVVVVLSNVFQHCRRRHVGQTHPHPPNFAQNPWLSAPPSRLPTGCWSRNPFDEWKSGRYVYSLLASSPEFSRETCEQLTRFLVYDTITTIIHFVYYRV